MTPIGTITNVHGVNGEFILEHYLDARTNVNTWDALMIELLAGSYIPFFISSAKKLTATTWKIKLEEINSPEEAKELIHKKVYPSPNIHVMPLVEKQIHHLIHYTIIYKDQPVGKIDNILNPNIHPIFIIHEGEKNELLIPANEQLIQEINHDKKEVIMNLPYGLLS